MAANFSITYKKDKFTVEINGKEVSNPNEVLILLPIYTQPIIKVIQQPIVNNSAVVHSVATTLGSIDRIHITGVLKDG